MQLQACSEAMIQVELQSQWCDVCSLTNLMLPCEYTCLSYVAMSSPDMLQIQCCPVN